MYFVLSKEGRTNAACPLTMKKISKTLSPS